MHHSLTLFFRWGMHAQGTCILGISNARTRWVLRCWGGRRCRCLDACPQYTLQLHPTKLGVRLCAPQVYLDIVSIFLQVLQLLTAAQSLGNN